jgi:ADP-ribose pyrophosphatase YjhB (NUDIX family)
LLEIADELRGIATTGLHYAEVVFDRERYTRLLTLAARLASFGAEHDAGELERLYFDADVGYATPKVDVRMAVFRGDGVLLVRERSDGRWALPGGYADIGDTPSDAAVRETAEEAGVEVRATRLVGVYDLRLRPEVAPHPFHIFKLLFAGDLTDAAAQPEAGSEATDARFWPLDALPELSLGRTLPVHIEHAHDVALGRSAPHFD